MVAWFVGPSVGRSTHPSALIFLSQYITSRKKITNTDNSAIEQASTKAIRNESSFFCEMKKKPRPAEHQHAKPATAPARRTPYRKIPRNASTESAEGRLTSETSRRCSLAVMRRHQHGLSHDFLDSRKRIRRSGCLSNNTRNVEIKSSGCAE